MSVSALVDEVSKLSEEEKNEFLVGVVSKMSVLSLSNLVKKIETKFEVKAASGGGTPFSGPPAPDHVPGDVQGEKTEFTLALKAVADATKKIAIIKEVRGITGLGLKEAKELVDRAPAVVREKMAKADAEAAKTRLEAAGAAVELR